MLTGLKWINKIVMIADFLKYFDTKNIFNCEYIQFGNFKIERHRKNYQKNEI